MASSYTDRLRTVAIKDGRTPALLAIFWNDSGRPALREVLRNCRTAFGLEQSGGDAASTRTGAQRKERDAGLSRS